MNSGFAKLFSFFELVKELSFWTRLFRWSHVRKLSYEAYNEFSVLQERIVSVENEISLKDSRIKELQNNLDNSAARLKDARENMDKLERKLSSMQGELSVLNKEKSELSAKVARFEQAEQTRSEEFNKNIASVNAIRKSLEEERQRLEDERVREIAEANERMKLTWRNHEESVKNAIRNLCRLHQIDYIEKAPFRGNPDNTVRIAGEYVVFDAKSPSGDDLDNFPKYIRKQAEEVKKYAKQDEVKSDIFLVIPSNTAEAVTQFSYNMGDYNVYVITLDSLEPVLLTLKKIESYEFVDQLTPEERENICRIIGKFTHTAKRKIQIDYFFSYQFLEILSKCGVDLPKDIYSKVVEFEKAEKLNPPQEKRSKQILLEDLLEESERLAVEAKTRLDENRTE
ncbi:MAG TPA: hypothetical protein P5257_03275 [Bacteroidales bacterium]|nr:hypothetical protein [Bacteroidales bacterium]HRT89117.1 hypothetical protein [Bacteroidales bacterium]